MADNVKVAVRMRPFNSRETGMSAKCCVRMVKETQQTVLVEPDSGKERTFTFDFSYNSFVARDDAEYASQEIVWRDIGVGVLQNAYEGYNCSLFAYGQTGAGKSYSMMGYGEDKGIIPIACERIFDRIDSNTDPDLTIKVEASMLEIYMEKVRDLFNPKAGELRIRNDPKQGFYVEKLTRNAVANISSINKLMEAGTMARTVAATNMNATSSRAHTIFQIILTQTKVDTAAGKATDKVAIINLIDLAGSERQSGTGATGDRLKEGSAINLSLSSLGNCISALATNSSGDKKVRVPYRDSVLTMLLQNSLGGNAKTIMIAAISPADVNHDETLSTLRYADRAKQIKNNAVVNEDPNEKMIRNLKSEIEQLRKALEASGGGVPGVGAAPAVDTTAVLEKEREEMRAKFAADADAERARIRAELEEKIRLEVEQSMSWEERLKETEARQREQEQELRAIGIATSAERTELVEQAKTKAHMVNLHEDAALSEQIFHFFEPGVDLRIGRDDAPVPQQVCISGLNIEAQHAVIVNGGDDVITLSLPTDNAKIHVNGTPVVAALQLRHNDRIIFGNNHVFKVVIPSQADSYVRPDDVPPHIDHTFAVMEIHKAQVQAIAAAEATRRAEAEAARLAAEEQIRAIESRLAEERQKAEEEAEKRRKFYEDKERELEAMRKEGLQAELKEQEDRLRKEKEEMFRKMQEQQELLEAKLQEQIAETNRQAKRQEREAKERNLLDEKLLKTIPLVNEANAYSDELGVGIAFSVKLMSVPGRKPNTNANSGAGDDDANDQRAHSLLETDVFIRVDGTVVSTTAAAVKASQSSSQKFWNYDKFMDRLYNMREMFQTYIEHGRSLAGTDYITDIHSDPFYDEPEDHHIGRATAYLDPLMYAMFVDEWTPIIDYKGQAQGELLLRVIPHKNAQPPEGDPDSWDEGEDGNGGQGFTVDSLEQLKGQRIFVTIAVLAGRGFPSDRCQSNFVKFRFFVEDDASTPRTVSKTINPKFAFSKTFPVLVSPEFQTYVSTETLEFEVYGREHNEELRPQTALPGSAYASVVAKKPDFAAQLSPLAEAKDQDEDDDDEGDDANTQNPSAGGSDMLDLDAERDAEEQAKIAAAVEAEMAKAKAQQDELAAQLAEFQAKAAAAEAAQKQAQAQIEAAREAQEAELKRVQAEMAAAMEAQRKQQQELIEQQAAAARQAQAEAEQAKITVQVVTSEKAAAEAAAERERMAKMQAELEALKKQLNDKPKSKVCAIM